MFILDAVDNIPKEKRNRVEASIGLVVYVLKKLHLTKHDDCWSEGLLGLVIADKTYNDTLDIKWSTYAYRVIKNTILTYLRTFEYKQVAYETELISENMRHKTEDELNFMRFVKQLPEIEQKIVVSFAYYDMTKRSIRRTLHLSQEKLDKETRIIGRKYLDYKLKGDSAYGL